MRKRLALTVAAIFFSALSADATVIDLMSIEELAEKSTLVVMGTAVGAHSYYNADSTLIFTDAHIKITDRIRGDCGSEIAIVLIGGTVGERTTFALGGPAFTIGSEVLLCLRISRDFHKYEIIGFNQGKFDIRDGKAFRDFKKTTMSLPCGPENHASRALLDRDVPHLPDMQEKPLNPRR